MTTIAIKDGIIATDGRLTEGSDILRDDADKHIERNGVHFWLSGVVAEFEDCVTAWFGGTPENHIMNVSGFVWDSGHLYTVSAGSKPDTVVKTPDLGPLRTLVAARGSGEGVAVGAMLAGCSSEEAVKLAMHKDAFTGGTVRTYNLLTGEGL